MILNALDDVSESPVRLQVGMMKGLLDCLTLLFVPLTGKGHAKPCKRSLGDQGEEEKIELRCHFTRCKNDGNARRSRLSTPQT